MRATLRETEIPRSAIFKKSISYSRLTVVRFAVFYSHYLIGSCVIGVRRAFFIHGH